MTFIQRVLEALDANLWKFVRIIHSTNRELPYHDAWKIPMPDADPVPYQHYTVGQNNISAHGDQHKYFTSKRMILWSNQGAFKVKINHADNIEVDSIPYMYNGTSTKVYHKLELHTNISEIWIQGVADEYMYLYCEGVLPQEARDAE